MVKQFHNNETQEHPTLVKILHKPAFAISLLVLGLILTITAWKISNDYIETRAREQFIYRTNKIENLVLTRMHHYEQVIRGGVGLFYANEVVTRDNWNNYVNSLNLQQHYPGIQGLGFSYRIPAGRKDSLTRAFHQNVYEKFTVYPDEKDAEQHAILFLEPLDWRNRRAIGFNMFSEENRRDAMVRARDSGQSAISGKIVLVQETNEKVQSGFTLYIPLYSDSATTTEERRENLFGYVYGAFRMEDLMKGILHEEPEDVIFNIYDGDSLSEESLLYSSNKLHYSIDEDYKRIEKATIAGRIWTLEFFTSEDFIAGHYTVQPLVIAIAGIIVELILFYLIWSSFSVNNFYRKAKKAAETNAHQLRAALQKRKVAEEALKEKQKMLQSAYEDLNTFIYSISHDIKNPLTAIMLHSQLVEEYEDIEEYKRFMALVNKNTQKIQNIIETMSQIIREEYKDITIEEINIEEEVSRITEDFNDTMENLNGIITMDLDVHRILYIKGFFRSILLNLLENAVKYRHPSREPNLVIKTTSINDYVVLTVTDNGRGIDLEKNKSKLFKPFQRFSKSTSGSGLGLFIVKRMIEKNGGYIKVESEEGSGTSFHCYLKPYGYTDEEIS